MKKMFLAVILLSGLSAYAGTADELVVTMDCNSLQPHNDYGLSVQLMEGGLVGRPQLKVERFFLGKTFNKTYFVEEVKSGMHAGQQIVYKGPGVRFSVNLLASPAGEDGFIGSLTEVVGGDATQTEDLLCQQM